MPRILIIDDEPALRESLRAELELADYEVHEAAEGTVGLERAERLVPDVIILDIRLPGLDGYAVCSRLKTNPITTRIPVIFLTGVEDAELSHRVRAAGGTACLTKPFRLPQLTALVQWVIANARREADQPRRSEVSDRNQELGRRRYRRFPVSLPVVGRAARFGDTEVLGTVRNIGGGGLMAEFPLMVSPGSLLDLVLQTRQGPFAVSGQVAWTGRPGPQVAHGIGFSNPCGDEFARELVQREQA